MRPRRLAIIAFAVYAPMLFLGTHWPNLRIDGPVERSDLWVHLGAFGLWSVLAASCGWFGEPGSWRNLSRAWLLSMAYAAVDESLQAIPALHRTAAWDDYAANAVGITLGSALVWAVRRVRGAIQPRW